MGTHGGDGKGDRRQKKKNRFTERKAQKNRACRDVIVKLICNEYNFVDESDESALPGIVCL